jgi:uncharacterized metal-binding protein
MLHHLLIGILVPVFLVLLILVLVASLIVNAVMCMWCINSLCCCKNKGFLVREIEAMDKAKDVEMAGIQSGCQCHDGEWVIRLPSGRSDP